MTPLERINYIRRWIVDYIESMDTPRHSYELMLWSNRFVGRVAKRCAASCPNSVAMMSKATSPFSHGSLSRARPGAAGAGARAAAA